MKRAANSLCPLPPAAAFKTKSAFQPDPIAEQIEPLGRFVSVAKQAILAPFIADALSARAAAESSARQARAARHEAARLRRIAQEALNMPALHPAPDTPKPLDPEMQPHDEEACIEPRSPSAHSEESFTEYVHRPLVVDRYAYSGVAYTCPPASGARVHGETVFPQTPCPDATVKAIYIKAREYIENEKSRNQLIHKLNGYFRSNLAYKKDIIKAVLDANLAPPPLKNGHVYATPEYAYRSTTSVMLETVYIFSALVKKMVSSRRNLLRALVLLAAPSAVGSEGPDPEGVESVVRSLGGMKACGQQNHQHPSSPSIPLKSSFEMSTETPAAAGLPATFSNPTPPSAVPLNLAEQAAHPAAPSDTSPAPSAATQKKRPRKSDRHLFTNPLPLVLSPPTTHWSLSAFVSCLLYAPAWTRRANAKPYDGVIVGDAAFVWILQDSSAEPAPTPPDRGNLETRPWRSVLTTIPVGGGPHAVGLGLWRGGFFGKANLSRGDPTWWTRRSGLGEEGESLATKRRAERTAERRRQMLLEAAEATVSNLSDPLPSSVLGPALWPGRWDLPKEDPERFQLMQEEAYFLAHGLGCLAVRKDEGGAEIDAHELWKLFRSRALSQLAPAGSPISVAPTPSGLSLPRLATDFAIRYAVFHHYRSRGWVVKSGIKFGTDFG
ncbi:hypothetical protein BDK51DRAFT_52009 [Blyttiomyces helicus]|uniref:tRNA-intron lyase n=1 Tax=Blyttiomyces helicus TaxID=388810 RepID=A0A4P9W2L5_9FUNG|nr:hypothetical protein BDK51DRAFT_52009 [Blyttiomyces helicus]|eukprot:RKO85413.1 hypothetical protein BDK51DRAFT_52009 [Blyttiomyces helicus]